MVDVNRSKQVVTNDIVFSTLGKKLFSLRLINSAESLGGSDQSCLAKLITGSLEMSDQSYLAKLTTDTLHYL